SRERHRQIEAKPEVGQIVLASRGGGVELGASLADLVDQLLVLASAAALQQAKVLESRRLDPAKAVAPVRGQDRRRRAVTQLHFGRQLILHAARRRRVELHRHTWSGRNKAV